MVGKMGGFIAHVRPLHQNAPLSYHRQALAVEKIPNALKRY
jgi:hypothetical protein